MFQVKEHPEAESAEWLATQNRCPHKQTRSISRGLVGMQLNGTLNPNLNLSTFDTKVEDGKVFVKVPPCSEMEEAFEKNDPRVFQGWWKRIQEEDWQTSGNGW